MHTEDQATKRGWFRRLLAALGWPLNAEPVSAAENYAFISYHHHASDTVQAEWLLTALETYSVPADLAKQLKVPPRLGKVFLASADLAATPHLWDVIVTELKKSRNLVVLCSPEAADRPWINDEILEFIRLGRRDRIFAVLLEGEPAESFPSALRTISTRPDEVERALSRREEPLAADLRPVTDVSLRRVRRIALLRLVAGMLGVGFDALQNRDQERQMANIRRIAFGAVVATVIVSGLAVWALINRAAAAREREAAVNNEAQSIARLADNWSAQKEVLDAESGYAASIAAKDRAQVRESLLRIRAQGISHLWDAPSRMGGNAILTVPDGKEVVAAQGDYTIRVLSIADGSERIELGGHRALVVALALSSDGKRLASADVEGSIHVWDMLDGSSIETYAPRPARVVALGFDRNGRLWSISSDNQLARREVNGTLATTPIPGNSVSAAVIRPDGPEIIAGDTKGFIRRISPENGTDLSAFKADKLAITSMAVDTEGKRVAEWGTDERYVSHTGEPLPCKCVRVWSLETSAFLGELFDSPGYPGQSALTFSPDGTMLAIATLSGSEIWDIGSQRLRKVEARRHGVGAAWSAAFSTDSKRLFAIGERLNAYDVASLEKLEWLGGHDTSASSLAFSPDGKRLVSAGLGGDLRFHDADTGQEMSVIDDTSGGLSSIEFDPTGRWIVGCTFSGGLKLWDMTAGISIERPARGYTKQCASLDSNDGRLAVAQGDMVVFYRLDGEPDGVVPLTGVSPVGVTYSPDGTQLAVANSSGQIRFYKETYYGTPEAVPLAPDINRLSHIAFSPNGRLFAAAGQNILVIWSVDKPVQPVHAITIPGEVNSMTFSPDGQLVALAMYGGVSIIDVINGTVIAHINPYRTLKAHITSVAFDPAGKRLAIGSDQGVIRNYTIGDGAETWTIRPPDRMPGDYSFTPDVAFSPKAARVAIKGLDQSIRLFDLTSRRLIDTISGDYARGEGLLFSADGRTLTTGSQRGVIRTVTLDGHSVDEIAVAKDDQPVNLITASKDASLFAFATHDSGQKDVDSTTIVVWDRKAGKANAVLTGHGRAVMSLAFNPVAPVLASASYDTTARLWDLTRPGSYRDLPGHAGSVTSITFSPDGKLVATASRDGFVRIFDASTAGLIATLEAATDSSYVEQVTFAPSGDVLIASGQGGTTIWQAGSWTSLVHLSGHDDQWVQTAAVDLTGTWLLTTSQDPYIRVWDLKALAHFREEDPQAILADSVKRTDRSLGDLMPR
ncbi:TIR domain-containing protein (plasmid) [Rhizobium beringeri]|uniref:WD40 domain-containing protein n=1 Tax=Rhizobium beringeri TaxID=3019934 RepID=UPI002E0D79D5|nr:TIR domain-containing protein [Rhizobium beringeri]